MGSRAGEGGQVGQELLRCPFRVCSPLPISSPPQPSPAPAPAVPMPPTSGKAELGFDPQPVAGVPEQLSQACGGGGQECWG